ncbi:MAG: class I SAM-dependent methyltransferase [Chloroflexota bacterium]|nr:class I SAM-dependent methyltransferase [Chloroflexota bacterium]
MLLNVNDEMQLNKMIEHYGVRISDWVHEVSLKNNISLKGKKILEIGPGGLLFQGLIFQAMGAEYTAIDAFQGNCLSEKARDLYARFLSDTSSFSFSYDLEWKDVEQSNLNYIPNMPLEKMSESLKGKKFDIIFSYGVLEHLYDIDSGFVTMENLLSDQGLAIHNIDYQPHDFWRDYENPLTHLCVPNFLYKMAYPKFRGYTNRLRHSDFMKSIKSASLKVISVQESEFYPKEVLEIRNSNGSILEKYSDEDLLMQRSTYILSR